MLWLLLLAIGWGLQLTRWFCFGRPRYPLQIIPPKSDVVVEILEFLVGFKLLVALVHANNATRTANLNLFCFSLTVLYHSLVTVWCRVWWRARLYNTLVVVLYVLILWWLVLLYREAGTAPFVIAFLVASYKSIDIYLVSVQ